MKDEVYAGIKEIADKEERKIGKVLEMMLEEYKKIQKNEK
jgi:hypothetical protein